jgi:outer membrane protein insertion porin family
MYIFRKAALSALALTVSAAAAWAQTPAPPPTPPQQPAALPQAAPSGQSPTPDAPARPQDAPAGAPPSPAGQGSLPPYTACGNSVVPAKQPLSSSGPILLAIAPCFEKQGGASVIEAQTYLYYIQTRASRPSQDVWVPYNETTEQQIRDDFKRLWATNFLDDLSIETKDYTFPNGVVGKVVVYNLEERQRVKIVDYVGTKQLEQTKIDEALKDQNIQIRLDSFIDDTMIRRVKGVIRMMLSEKGFLDSTVSHEIKPITGPSQKLVNITFHIDEGPKYKIRKIEFVGAKAVSSGKLASQMKETKAMWPFSWITGRGVYKETKYEEDAEKVQAYYRDQGYITTQVGNPEIRTIETTKDNKTRFIELRIPVIEGPRYKVAKLDFAENKVVKSEALKTLFEVKEGDYYSEKKIRKGLEKSREVYGTGGYWEFTGYPSFKRHDEVDPADPPEKQEEAKKSKPIVDVTMHMQEGEQFFVNRVNFVGNSTTRDHVIRREVRVVEGAPFNTEALKYSVKRLNQLGYFKPIEPEKQTDAVKVEKVAGQKNKVDVTLKLEEQNRNQLQFGAGYSEFEGTFLQFSFATSNFLGRGETLSTSILTGNRYKDYEVSFTEPFLFDRPITGGVNVFNRNINYPLQFTQVSTGGSMIFSFPVADFTRLYMGYSLENVRIKDLNPAFLDPNTGKIDFTVLSNNPFLRDALLINPDGTPGGRRIVSKVTPSLRRDTIDNPIFPTTGKRFTLAMDVAGLGGNTKFIKPSVESIFYFQHTRKTSLGLRGQFQFIQGYGSGGGENLPIFERLVLGGEYSIRGYDIRSIGPYAQDVNQPIVVGGNKSLLFNGEYTFQIAQPVRLIAFYDTGQVRDFGQQFAMNEWRSSTGLEVRFFMPVLNVPFRLIFARNINYNGVFDNSLNPEKKLRFRFAVGSTF